jgi:hypothetical protein
MRALIVSGIRPCEVHGYYREFDVDFEVTNREDSVHTVMVPQELPVNFGINDMIEFDGSLHTYYIGETSKTYIKITSMTVIDPNTSCDNTMCITGVIKKIDRRPNNNQAGTEDYRMPVTRFSVSVQEGNERELYYCVAFKKQATDIAALEVGTKIFVQGKLAKRHFTDKKQNAKVAIELYVRFYSPQIEQWDERDEDND